MVFGVLPYTHMVDGKIASGGLGVFTLTDTGSISDAVVQVEMSPATMLHLSNHLEELALASLDAGVPAVQDHIVYDWSTGEDEDG